jgi:hypothetical protein
LYIAPGFLLSKFGVLHMSFSKGVNEAILKLSSLANTVRGAYWAGMPVQNDIAENVAVIDAVLRDARYKINTVEGKRILAESQRDSLLMAIAGTNEGRNLDITNPDEAISEAMAIVRSMDTDIRMNREAEEIPFGAVDQGQDKMRVDILSSALLSVFCELQGTELGCYSFAGLNPVDLSKPENVDFDNIIEVAIYTIKGLEEKRKKAEKTARAFQVGRDVNVGWIAPRKTQSHELKILPEFFESVLSGEKKAEIRLADRSFTFCVGDELWLREWTKQSGYTGRNVYREITHVTDLKDYAPGYVMLSMKPE